MKKGGNISIKLTNILKQTQECCNKKKCPKGSKRCKPKKKKSKKDDNREGLFGGMPNIKPASRAIPMPQSVINNITPVPNIPMPRQLPAYSQFRRPHAMYQRNDRPLQVQQGRGIRQPERQPLMVSSGIQTARRQAIARPRQQLTTQQLPPISVQSGIRGQGVIATQAPKQLKKQELTTQQLQPINIQSQRQGLTTQLLQPININPTKTRGVISDNQIRGSQGTADQPFNAPVPTPNILDIDSIRMRNEEQDRRDVARDLVQRVNQRIEETIEDIGQGTPRIDKEEEKEEERPSSPEVIFSDVTDDETDEELDNQIEGVERLIAQEQDVAMAQGQAGFVRDQREQINEREIRPQIDDVPTREIRRGRPQKKDQEEVARRRAFFRENDMENFYDYTHNEVLNEDMTKYDYPQATVSGDIRDYARVVRPAGTAASSFV